MMVKILSSFNLTGSFLKVTSKNFFLMVKKKKGKESKARKDKKKEKQPIHSIALVLLAFQSDLANKKCARDMVATAKEPLQLLFQIFQREK